METTRPGFTFMHDLIRQERMKKQASCNTSPQCRKKILAIKDAMEILSGKWKFHILGTLLLNDKMRFMDLLREVDGIAAKMLSKELHDMEMNQLITRRVIDTKPVTVEYELTEYGRSVEPIINEIAGWGMLYRKGVVA
ncbi:DNA-binding HxlR family transcriptional regulator [Dyadobacter sp. BE31]|nr:DNA-binding HxlR family transcriptional regulator [Dyadobacter sp. BE31]